jgi:hypothetical protein
MECTTVFSSVPHIIMAMLGVNANGASVRFMQVDTVGDYWTCEGVMDIDTPEALLRVLMDTNHCDHLVLRVDMQTDDGLCASYRDCKNSGLDAFTDLKAAIGMGHDGGPVLRIMLSNDQS